MNADDVKSGEKFENGQLFKKIISIENLTLAWKEFKKGKRKKRDVQIFKKDLTKNIMDLYFDLKDKKYKHSDYSSFYVKDPKLRHIHKAVVRDRLLHHAVFRILYFIFDKSFVFDSYSCRLRKGTHKAVSRLREFVRKESKNNTRNCFVLKCDIKKFFDSIDHETLITLIKKRTTDKDAIWLIEEIIKSYSVFPQKGIPLGNITSQLFANIYLNELDRFVKHKLKIKFYIRYCDDFLILSSERDYLETLLCKIAVFLKDNLMLFLHPHKITIRKYRQGIDFLGYVCFPYHKVLRIKTAKRMLKNIKSKSLLSKKGAIAKESFDQTIQSYFGVLKHCNSYDIKALIKDLICGSKNI